MYKVKVFIENESEYYDKDVFVICNLVAIPRIGEHFLLEEKIKIKLEKKVKDKKKYKNWYFGTKENSYLSFDDATTVIMVGYNSNSKYVKIVLGS